MEKFEKIINKNGAYNYIYTVSNRKHYQITRNNTSGLWELYLVTTTKKGKYADGTKKINRTWLMTANRLDFAKNEVLILERR